MVSQLRTLTALFIVMLVAGCGQSGPLYLPGDPSEIQPPPEAQQDTEQANDEDSTEPDAN